MERPVDRLRGFAKRMRSEQTDHERRLWGILRARRLEGLKFRRQAPLGPYIADFASFRHRVVVELDGSQHGESAYDAVRDAWLRGQGFTVVRFWNHEVMDNADGVVRTILAAVERRL